ncbi:MAG TPA: universal stress protein [Opitutus sp.]|nr:universal stress protein [Opitutus sp.]
MKTVLAPIDFSHTSERVISSAIKLARAVDARLVLLNVIPLVRVEGCTMSLTLAAADLAAETEKDVAKRLTRLQRSLRDDGVTAHVAHVSGDPRSCILEQVEKFSANYVVMAAHGDRAFDRSMIGGTAGGVLRRATCPVVIIPEAEKPAERFTRKVERPELVGV